MFIDEAVIKAFAGDGGDGCYANLREKYRPMGGPSGGNGGRGGHVIIRGSTQLHTLQDIAFRKEYHAPKGAPGKGKNQYGKYAEDVIVDVPLGTVLFDHVTGEMIFDCLREGEEVIVAKGGRGGRGNAALVTKKNLNPETAEKGKPGGQRVLRLELKVLADVGLVGRPNAGKSTFLTAVSHARPKVADYPFTTLQPHLGIVVPKESYSSFVVADIPGLIEGSHQGKGLGIKFLRHIERTKILAIMVESLSEDPEADAEFLLHELSQYSPILAQKPKCFIMTKADLGVEPEHLPKGWLLLSAVTGQGVWECVQKLYKMLEVAKPEPELFSSIIPQTPDSSEE